MDDAKIKVLLFPDNIGSWDSDEWDWKDFGSSWARFFITFVRFYSQEEEEISRVGQLELELAYAEMLEDFFDRSYLEGKSNREMHFNLPGAKELLGQASQIVIQQLLVSYNRKDPQGLAEKFKNVFDLLNPMTFDNYGLLETAQTCVNDLRKELQRSEAPFAKMILSHFDEWV